MVGGHYTRANGEGGALTVRSKELAPVLAPSGAPLINRP